MSEGIIVQQKTDLIPIAKRLILIESFDKYANVTLANNTAIIVNTLAKDHLNHETLSLPKSIIENIKRNKPFDFIENYKRKIAKKYFKLWQNVVKQKREYGNQKEKIDAFIEQLRKRKDSRCKKNNDLKENDNDHSKNPSKCIKNKFKDTSEIYDNRYRAQQDLIQNQKLKLQRQDKIIQNLKLGIIIDETEKSLENSRYDIREVYRNCSEKVKCKITPPDAVEKDVNIIELRTSKAPKIMAQMEKRAAEREMRRTIILEKKRIMEEGKRREAERAIEEKRTLDEDQKQRSLEAIKERRRLEVELERKRQENRQKYLDSIKRANRLYSRKMKRKFFNAFKKLMDMKIEYELKSELFYKNLLERKSLNRWTIFVKEKMEKDNFEADYLYSYKLRKKMLKAWHSVLILRKQSIQVAEDLYDMKLQSTMFIRWHRHICKQQMTECKNLQIAERHYNSRIVLQYFYQWKSLPAVLQLEKAKEEKKRKWREKVWEIVPDYQPYTEVI